MEEKKVNKIGVSTIFLILSLLVIVIMGIFIYKLNNDKTDQKKKISELEAEATRLNTTVEELQEKINTVSKVINDEDPRTEQDKYTNITSKLGDDDMFYPLEINKNNDGAYTLKGVIYTRFTLTKSELDNAVNSGYKYYNLYDLNSQLVNYTVKKDYENYDYAFIGKINDEDRVCFYAVKKDDNTYYIENPTENNREWKLSNDYKKIIVSENIEVENDGGNTTVGKYFNNFTPITVEETKRPNRLYTFEFNNGNCSKIIEFVAGH